MTEQSEPKQQVFVISPIGSRGSEARRHADLFLKYIVREALPESEYDVIRADEEDSPYAITESMLGRILKADLCVADLTGLNPNVMYELALAHAADKKVVIMTADAGPPPFDIKDLRVVKYGLQVDEAQEAVVQLREKAKHVPPPGSFEKMLNPVASAFQEWTQRQQINTDEAGPDKAIVALVEKLEQRVESIDSRAREAETQSWDRQVRMASHVLSDPEPPIRIEVAQVMQEVLGSLRKLNDPRGRGEAERLLEGGERLIGRYELGVLNGEELDHWVIQAHQFLSRNKDVAPTVGFLDEKKGVSEPKRR